MDNSMMKSYPDNVKKELEAIQKLILPIAKKTSKYMFWTFPLIAISIFNLAYLLFFSEWNSDMIGLMIVYAFAGALGFALLRETKLNKKEIEKIGVKYMIDRIKKSRSVSEDRKHQYIQSVRQMPVHAMDHFIRFLQEEERVNKRMFSNED